MVYWMTFIPLSDDLKTSQSGSSAGCEDALPFGDIREDKADFRRPLIAS